MSSVQEKLKASSDEAIVKRVQQGDINAYNILVIKYQHKIIQTISKFLGDSADVSDVAQDAFIKAYKALPSFRGESSFYTWLYRIAVNCAKSFLEANAKHKNHLDVDSEEFMSTDAQTSLTSKDTPDRIIESQELQRVILEAMNELPNELRQAIYLREVDGRSYDEIAEVMQVPVGTVRSRIFRARQMIEDKMSRFAKR